MNHSACTVKGYRITLSLYLVFLEEEKKITPATLLFSHFGREYVEEWLKWMKEKRKCSPASCNIRLAAMKSFLKYVGSRDVTYLYLSQEAALIPKQKTVRKKVSGISKNAVKTLMMMPDTKTKTGRRDIALLVFMYGTAARLDEVLSMTVGQLNLETAKPFATIIGKGSRMRTLYLLPKAVAHLKAYLTEFHKDCDGRHILFYSKNKGKNEKLSQPAIDKQLKKYAKEANKICADVPLNLHAHQLRHAKASHWLEDGMNTANFVSVRAYNRSYNDAVPGHHNRTGIQCPRHA
jgi:site-specific recombinase XerD